jgi:arsenate reductase (glutaredoxin)
VLPAGAADGDGDVALAFPAIPGGDELKQFGVAVQELLRKMGMKAADLLRTKEPVYKTLKLGERTLTEDEIVDAMVKHPDLIQRPIVEKGSRAILARPAERLKEILEPR